jgi:ribosomal protein S27E
MKFIDLTGLKFNKLTVKKHVGKNKNGHSLWKCLCDCGNEKIVFGHHLRSENIKSCGCYRKQSMAENIRGLEHGMSKTRTYFVWKSMLNRCNNKNCESYKWYGGRGITVCDKWNPKKGGSFEKFYQDVGEIPKKLTLDRIDNDGNYEPNNWKLSTMKEQNRNKRNNFRRNRYIL